MHLRALIFDIDGTLAETEELHRLAFNDTFAALNVAGDWPDPKGHWHWNVATYATLLKTTGGKERIAAYMDGSLGIAAAPHLPRIAEIHAHKTRRFGELISSSRLPLRSGIERNMLIGRKHGLAIAAATTTSHPNVDAVCRACFGKPAGEIFDVIAAGDDVAKKKPAPEIYLLALERLDLDAAACLAFEDSRNGLLAAKAAGLRCFVSPSLYTAAEDLAEADLLIAEFDDAIPHLGRLIDQARREATRL
jgi:HAD superfamily hydrolase (TIGR01509 family)